MSVFWIVVLSIVGLALLGVVFYFSINLIFYNISLSKNNITRLIIKSRMKKHYKEYKIDFSWFSKHQGKTFTIKKDGLKLVGNFYERKRRSLLAIVCHGYGADFKEMSEYVKYFYNRGFNVFLPELRAHGKSEGNRMGMGWADRLDLKKWIEFMLEINPKFQIVLFGLSMGASTVCMTVGENLPSNVKCAISDCAYDNVYDQFEFVSKRLKGVSSKLIMKMYNNFLMHAFDINLLRFDAIRQVKKAKVPMLFIHGDQDEFVPYENLKKLYDAHPLKNHKYIYTCPGARHAMSYATDEEEYKKQLTNFLEKEFYK